MNFADPFSQVIAFLYLGEAYIEAWSEPDGQGVLLDWKFISGRSLDMVALSGENVRSLVFFDEAAQLRIDYLSFGLLPVPEPTGIQLMGIGLAAIAARFAIVRRHSTRS